MAIPERYREAVEYLRKESGVELIKAIRVTGSSPKLLHVSVVASGDAFEARLVVDQKAVRRFDLVVGKSTIEPSIDFQYLLDQLVAIIRKRRGDKTAWDDAIKSLGRIRIKQSDYLAWASEWAARHSEKCSWQSFLNMRVALSSRGA